MTQSVHTSDTSFGDDYCVPVDALPHLVWVVDSRDRFLYANYRWIEYTGLTFEPVDGGDWRSVVATDDLTPVEAAWMQSCRSGAVFEVECRLRRADGEYRWFLVRAVPVHDGTRRLGTCTDIHEHKQAEEMRRFVVELDARMHAAHTPEEILAEVVEGLGRHLGAARCCFTEIDWEANTTEGVTIYNAPGIPVYPNAISRSLLSPITVAELIEGKTQAVDDVWKSPRDAENAARLEAVGIRALVAVPILRAGRHVGSLAVLEVSRPRQWRSEEISLIQTVAEHTWLAVENVRHYRAKQELEARQRDFICDVLSSVTDGRLRLCDGPDGLPATLPSVGPTIRLDDPGDLSALRRRTREVAAMLGFDAERSYDLMTASGEAAMNAVVHGTNGRGDVCTDGKDTVQVWVTDEGGGIAMEALPKATMARGYSTASTLGYGFKMILMTIDRVFLVTDATGTTVVLEQDRQPPEPMY